MVRGKMIVTAVKNFDHRYFGDSTEVTLTAQYDSSIAEDVSFSKATPSGNITLYVSNPAAIKQLTIGKAFYLDLTEVEG